MKIVVTGALGHIGSALIRALPERFPGAEIVMIDNMATQRYPSLFDLPAQGRYRFIEADVRDADVSRTFGGADAVVHLAAMTDAEGSVERAAEVEANNFQATEAVAMACAAMGVRLIHLSSTSVYGTQDATVAEDCPLGALKPQSPYAATKLKEEQLVMSLSDKGLRAAIVRFGTVFGVSPGMRFHTAVNKFCWQAATGRPLTVWRTAYEQKRPYLDLRDAVEAITFIVTRDLFDGRVYNVLTLNATVRQIVELVVAEAPDVTVSLVDSPIMNQLSYDVSARRFAEAGFVAAGDLRRGIAETVALLRGLRQRAPALIEEE
ncbi:MAG: SDR family oxidoreductase [Proteobacteria bacterium]|nr:SDR family oxidoreductase [Pseudomonadota bacterium]